MWTSGVYLMFISLTVQWIDVEFTPQRVLLQTKHFGGSHSGQAIGAVFKEMLHYWGVPKSSVHVVL